MAAGDGRHALEVKGKQVVMEMYTVGDQLYYDVFVDGDLKSKQGAAQPGEDHQAVIDRIRRTIEGGQNTH